MADIAKNLKGGEWGEELPLTAFWETLKLSEQRACFLVSEGSKDSEEDEERLPKGWNLDKFSKEVWDFELRRIHFHDLKDNYFLPSISSSKLEIHSISVSDFKLSSFEFSLATFASVLPLLTVGPPFGVLAVNSCSMFWDASLSDFPSFKRVLVEIQSLADLLLLKLSN